MYFTTLVSARSTIPRKIDATMDAIMTTHVEPISSSLLGKVTFFVSNLTSLRNLLIFSNMIYPLPVQGDVSKSNRPGVKETVSDQRPGTGLLFPYPT
jgi:hypothetical protein